jgi:signal transduction histidine kinase
MNLTLSRTLLFESQTKFNAGILSFIATFIIGDIDYLTGYTISLLAFYILPVGFATIYVGPAFAALLSIMSVVIWIGSNLWAGMPAPYSETSILAWNAAIVLSVFSLIIGFLHVLNRILLRLESSVEEKTRDLISEISERERLQREIIDLPEREQHRLGQELHDVVCQELASVAIAAQMLARKLPDSVPAERAHADEIARMADHALESTRRVARGFFTAGFDNTGLQEALRESARHTEKTSGISCVIDWQENLTIPDEKTVMHLFRIAQEAIRNAVNHAAASHIKVSLALQDKMLRLMIEDDGKGLSSSDSREKGLGLRIMAYRAGLIGGELKTETPRDGGTCIVCLVPLEN